MLQSLSAIYYPHCSRHKISAIYYPPCCQHKISAIHYPHCCQHKISAILIAVNTKSQPSALLSTQTLSYPLHFHLCRISSLLLPSPSTLKSNQTITIASDTRAFVTLRLNSNIWWRIVFFRWVICLEQFASVAPPLRFFFLFRTRGQNWSAQ